jgi:hypothetical protein
VLGPISLPCGARFAERGRVGVGADDNYMRLWRLLIEYEDDDEDEDDDENENERWRLAPR